MLRSDLIVAIEQCLQQKTANRWPDAKSLRSELVPMDDDTDVPAVRLLRFSSIAAIAHPLVPPLIRIRHDLRAVQFWSHPKPWLSSLRLA